MLKNQVVEKDQAHFKIVRYFAMINIWTKANLTYQIIVHRKHSLNISWQARDINLYKNRRNMKVPTKLIHNLTGGGNRPMPIYMVVLTSGLEVSFDVKRGQCNWTKTRTLELRVYTELQNDWGGVVIKHK